MGEPQQESDGPNLHPGRRDEGGTGGMATRELQAEERAGPRTGERAGKPDEPT